jgi:hypothetical protein
MAKEITPEDNKQIIKNKFSKKIGKFQCFEYRTDRDTRQQNNEPALD